MLNETPKSIFERVANFSSLDAMACRLLTSACLLIEDEESALELLRQTRAHVRITDDTERMYEVDYYLGYVKDLVDILSNLKVQIGRAHV